MITEIKNTILEKYQVRKGKKRKTAFIEYIEGICRENGIECTVEKKGISRNIVMGASPDQCDFVIGGHYDTCPVMIIPNFVTPRNFLAYLVYQLVLCALLFVPALLVSGVLTYFTDAFVGIPVFGLVTMLMCLLLMFGPANKHTANDNTSGVIAVLNTMLTMTPEQRSRICFVLFDNEEIGLVGSSAFADMHRNVKKGIPVVNFDCVSDGDYLFAKMPHKEKKTDFGKAFASAMERSAEKHGMTPAVGSKGFYPSDQANFKRGIGVASLNRSKLVGLYMNRIHTPRDTVFIDRNIDCLTDAMIDLVDGEK